MVEEEWGVMDDEVRTISDGWGVKKACDDCVMSSVRRCSMLFFWKYFIVLRSVLYFS